MQTIKTQAELQQAHGTPQEFEAACKRAWLDGWVTFEEATKAVDDYEKEFTAAPESELERKRAFMRLPLTERRKLMAQAAELVLPEYLMPEAIAERKEWGC